MAVITPESKPKEKKPRSNTSSGGAIDVLRAKLTDALSYAEKHQVELRNEIIPTRLRQLLHQHLGGAPEKRVASQTKNKSGSTSARRQIVHTPESVLGFKKKDQPIVKAVKLADKSPSELKAIAQGLGLNIKKKTPGQLVSMIEWHQKGEQDRRKKSRELRRKAEIKKQNKAIADEKSGLIASQNISADEEE